MPQTTDQKPDQITLTDLRANLAHHCATVAHTGTPITVTQHGKPYVTLCKPQSQDAPTPK